MTERSLTPNITVTIGHHTRIYFAFVTTAPAELDSPATVTLHAATVRRRRPASRPNRSRSTAPADGYRRDWFSSTRWSSPGNEPSTAAISTRCCRRIRGSSASTRCSTGCGNGFRRPAASQVAA